MKFRTLLVLSGLLAGSQALAQEQSFNTLELQQNLRAELQHTIASMNNINHEIAYKTARELESLNLQLTLEELISRAHNDVGILAAKDSIAE